YTHFFLLMPRPPPSSTLFPYTTLFRSRRYQSRKFLRREGTAGVAHVDVGVLAEQDRQGIERDAVMLGQPLRELLEGADVVVARLHRKSTRLNSSHRTISYAVFCLKKKR